VSDCSSPSSAQGEADVRRPVRRAQTAAAGAAGIGLITSSSGAAVRGVPVSFQRLRSLSTRCGSRDAARGQVPRGALALLARSTSTWWCAAAARSRICGRSARNGGARDRSVPGTGDQRCRAGSTRRRTSWPICARRRPRRPDKFAQLGQDRR
jgi:hypothetical protein